MAERAYRIERLVWEDRVLASIPLPGGDLVIRSGFGSGLATRPGDPPGRVWAIGDRGPNIKVRDAVARYNVDHLTPLAGLSGAKIMPAVEFGPALAELQVTGNIVELVRTLPLTHADGRPVSGLPMPGSDQLLSEPVFDLDGAPIPPDPGGMDSEGLIALADGGFWVGDEFGPSLVRLDADARVMARRLPGAASLPPIAARRQLNRGFESLAISGDGRWLFLAFQSPLAHPDEDAHRSARHVRIWRIHAASGQVVAEYAYPLDPPTSFARDCALGPFAQDDVKVSELLWLTGDEMLVLERGSQTTKLYRCVLSESCALPDDLLDIQTRPTLEQRSAASAPLDVPVLAKTLLLTTDDAPDVAGDLEGMAMLSPTELLLVSDNDFGVEGAVTSFWRVTFADPIVPFETVSAASNVVPGSVSA